MDTKIIPCGRYAMYLDEFDNIHYGWVEPFQLWLPFEHLDFLWGNLVRSEVPLFRSKWW
jgi:hypothetical protein